jgi:hypothetical protein
MKHKFKIRIDAVRDIDGNRTLNFQTRLEAGEKYVCPLVIFRTTKDNVDLKIDDLK